MAWKRLTSVHMKDTTFDVNMDNVTYIYREPTRSYTAIHFVGTSTALAVKEIPDEIHKGL